jgi:methylmalonyl-CoA mutase N-terminal domain/subunit
VKTGFPQREIADAAYEFQQRVDAGDFKLVGVNAYTLEDEEPLPILRIDPALESKQVGRVQAVRTRREGAEVERTLARVREVAATEENLMPALLDAARAHATEGEIVEALQAVWGTYTETPLF